MNKKKYSPSIVVSSDTVRNKVFWPLSTHQLFKKEFSVELVNKTTSSVEWYGTDSWLSGYDQVFNRYILQWNEPFIIIIIIINFGLTSYLSRFPSQT